jgi:hypothetical protein
MESAKDLSCQSLACNEWFVKARIIRQVKEQIHEKNNHIFDDSSHASQCRLFTDIQSGRGTTNSDENAAVNQSPLF